MLTADAPDPGTLYRRVSGRVAGAERSDAPSIRAGPRRPTCGRRRAGPLAVGDVDHGAAAGGGRQPDGLRAGAMDTPNFESYVEPILVPELQPGDVVVWDNLQPHQSAEARRLIGGPPGAAATVQPGPGADREDVLEGQGRPAGGRGPPDLDDLRRDGHGPEVGASARHPGLVPVLWPVPNATVKRSNRGRPRCALPAPAAGASG